MRYREIISELGTIVKGVNTTVDVKPGETARQAAKFGNKVTAAGIPPMISKDSVIKEGAKIATPDQLLQWARKNHHRSQDFEEGDLENRIWKFSRYVLRNLPVDRLYSPFHVDDDLVGQYVERLHNGEQMPPIIYDMVDDIVIDGGHRIAVAQKAGLATIPAWVGTRRNIDPNWSDSEED